MPHFCGNRSRWRNNVAATRKNRVRKGGPATSVRASSPTRPTSLPQKKPSLVEAFLNVLKRGPFESCVGRDVRVVPKPGPGILKIPKEHHKVVDTASTEMAEGEDLEMKRVTFDDVVKVSDNAFLDAGVLFSCT